MNVKPGYLSLHESGELEKRISVARERLRCCTLCPRHCKVNRLEDELGFCKTGKRMSVASYAPHFGEEAPLVGRSGSGTIFVFNCNLGCVFCQNYEISHLGDGVTAEPGQVAAIMVSLQKQGCHNINFVTPSHVVPQILEALPFAIAKGLTLPLVYNSSGYDSVQTLKLLDGVVDIYMPDFKFWDKDSAERLTKAPDYPARARAAISEMYGQVGDLYMDQDGIAIRGLLARHLVMPNGLAETGEIVRFLAGLSTDTYINIMDQYRPMGRAVEYPTIDRPLDHDEYVEAVRLAREAGLHRLDEKDFAGMLLRLGIV